MGDAAPRVAQAVTGRIDIADLADLADIMDAVSPGSLGGTYCGNPVACAAAADHTR
ncbi:aminotransferase class III-fold pyridoxal phosphate-dependent enzyme [Actinomyces sp. 2119]|uniref:aminotransferase class III-fold pyridoxal phosphate-dependent enzyme n=1 Tax=Actinomyces sp. 2119 TaxID=2321393 RepID=UPI000E6D58AB|nr:aminotransferase class III-fold pyridoxal phosphate-dependent enzyme [Actinomyces sp. 2119]RJF43916.1 aminotransferase class III-fold pyridoxal phosphate-dependent enzyme [Actinomyces sp. 2119]